MTRHILACGMSRSGTTLLATILDSHPRISMGYELLPSGLPPPDEAIRELNEALQSVGNDARGCGEHLAEAGSSSLGAFVKRCGRALVPPDALLTILERFRREGRARFDDLEARGLLSLAVAEAKMTREGTSICGFKLNAPSVEAFDAVLPDAGYLFILRDPRDVVASHFANRFDRTCENVCRAWRQYLERFDEFARANPHRTHVVRYEDLVTSPEEVLRRAFDRVGLPFDPAVLRFFDSKASIHSEGHVNADALRQGFLRTSVGRWRRELDPERVLEIERSCGTLMRQWGYRLSTDEEREAGATVPIPRHQSFARKKMFFRDQYAALLEEHGAGRVNLTWREVCAGERQRGQDVLILRHDIDHDYETALRIAEWEHARALRATYCVLHTAWYYGKLVDGGMVRYREMVEACRRIQALGHEINLHNNFVVVGLRHGLDPARLLGEELDFLRSNGIDVVGTSTHGDALCRELGFRNYELFAECVWESRGGPRSVEYRGRRVDLGEVSLKDFELEYEAYDIPRDLYVTDSGGHLRMRTNTRARGGKHRDELDLRFPYPTITGVLTHPIWWDFQRDAPASRTLPALEDRVHPASARRRLGAFGRRARGLVRRLRDYAGT